MGSATIGRGLSDFTRYHLWRNTLWIIAKDLPAAALVRHAPQLALGPLVNLAGARRAGLPRVLRKRRRVKERRRVTLAALEAVVGPDRGPQRLSGRAQPAITSRTSG